jgi:hypothetical protein
MRVSKGDKMGSYICRIGTYEVRQKVTFPQKIKGYGRGQETKKGTTEGRIYKGKNLVEGKFVDGWHAVQKAYKLVCREGNTNHVPQKIVDRYNLSC